MDGTTLLDEEYRAIAAAMPFAHVGPEVLEQLRTPIPGPPPEATTRTDVLVPGEPPVPVRVHRPRDAGTGGTAAEPLPCIVSMHGGGYVGGSNAMDDLRFERWCPLLGVVGVSVDYRLAPETPYPGPLEDCHAVLRWVHANADELGVDPSRIGLHGISAGGGLAAALALLARDRGEVPVAFQHLDCPMIDDRLVTPSSRLEGLVVWSRRSNEFGWRSYLGERFGGDDVPYTAAAARCTDLAGLPPAFVSVGGADGFRDEDVDYALRLYQAGVPTELHVYPGAPHGYQLLPDSRISRQARRDSEEWLARQVTAAPV